MPGFFYKPGIMTFSQSLKQIAARLFGRAAPAHAPSPAPEFNLPAKIRFETPLTVLARDMKVPVETLFWQHVWDGRYTVIEENPDPAEPGREAADHYDSLTAHDISARAATQTFMHCLGVKNIRFRPEPLDIYEQAALVYDLHDPETRLSHPPKPGLNLQ